MFLSLGRVWVRTEWVWRTESMPNVSSTLWFMELVRTVTHNACTPLLQSIGSTERFSIRNLFYIAPLVFKSAVLKLCFFANFNHTPSLQWLLQAVLWSPACCHLCSWALPWAINTVLLITIELQENHTLTALIAPKNVLSLKLITSNTSLGACKDVNSKAADEEIFTFRAMWTWIDDDRNFIFEWIILTFMVWDL